MVHPSIAQLITHLITGVFLFIVIGARAQCNVFYTAAKTEIARMLSGEEPLDYERAVFLTENAYYDNQLNEEEYRLALDISQYRVEQLMSRISKQHPACPSSSFLIPKDSAALNIYRATANFALFNYMTDTTLMRLDGGLFIHYPYRYTLEDPFATEQWEHSQVVNLLDPATHSGNCLALATLFKLLSLRLNSQVWLCTTQGHIFIRHADEQGIFYNVEIASRAFPGTGSIETLTYTSDKAARSGIAMRELDLKQSIGLCLVNLAKGYQHKTGIKADTFLLECAELALQYDSLNLNALLLKAEVMEEQLLASGQPFAVLKTSGAFPAYQQHIQQLYRLGYREMPLEMKNRIVAALMQDSMYSAPMQDHTYYPFTAIDKTYKRSTSLSQGLFEEVEVLKPREKYFRTVLDRKTQMILGFEATDTLYNRYSFDPVVFAWSIDPLVAKYPMISPYAAFGDNPIYYIDTDGADLGVNGNKTAASADLYSLLPPSASSSVDYRAALTVSDAGKVSFNITKAQADASGDPGVRLLYNLVNAEEKYEYNVANSVDVAAGVNDDSKFLDVNLDVGDRLPKSFNTTIDLKNGAVIDSKGNKQYPSNLGVVNASKIPEGELLSGGKNSSYKVPLDNSIDGQVTLPEGNYITRAGAMKPRRSLLLHELWENYNRTTNKQQYKDAHNNAINMEKSLPVGDPRRDTGYEGKGGRSSKK